MGKDDWIELAATICNQAGIKSHLNEKPKPAHSELAHNHIYLSRGTSKLSVSGIIDWAEAIVLAYQNGMWFTCVLDILPPRTDLKLPVARRI